VAGVGPHTGLAGEAVRLREEYLTALEARIGTDLAVGWSITSAGIALTLSASVHVARRECLLAAIEPCSPLRRCTSAFMRWSCRAVR
jgi:hypothetical protein